MAVDNSYTKSLLHFNSELTDESGKTWTAAGHAAVSTAQQKFGAGSLYCDGTGDYIYTADHSDFNVGNGLFTISMWSRQSVSDTKCLFSKRANSSAYAYMLVFMFGGNYNFFASSNGSSWDLANGLSIGAISVNNWQYISISRDATNIYCALGGTITQTIATTASINVNSSDFRIGAESDGYSMNGYVDEFIFKKGECLYTANYSVPTAEFAPPSSTFVPRIVML